MNLETIKPAAAKAGRAIVRAHVAAIRALWAALLWLLAAAWGVTKWAGRVVLWLFCWPLGLWRSYRHGEDRRNRKVAEAIARAQADRDRKAA